MEGRVPSRPAVLVLTPLVEMELDLPLGWVVRCGVEFWFLEGRVPSRPAMLALAPLVEMELDLPLDSAVVWPAMPS